MLNSSPVKIFETATLTVLILMCFCGLTKATGQSSQPGLDTASSLTTDRALLYPSTPEALLAPGDEISVRLFGVSDYTFSGRIAVDGTVLLPLIGITHLQGLSIIQAEQFIAKRLQDEGQYRDPQVTLTLAEGPNATITLSGEMHGVVPVVGSRSLYAALAVGGGLPQNASRTVSVLRPGQTTPIMVDIGLDPARSAAANIPLFPGDTVVVHRLGVIYVSGEFKTPGTVPLTNYGPLTLSQASALVGGPVFDAKYSELHIIRTTENRRTVSTVNLKDVLYGKAPDPILQANDILFLPPSALKQSLANGSFGAILGTLSFALATIYTLR